ncbi:hypothetical protein [Fischerella sp. JS2]|uniref:hypothetical protein n=1 Tax=Fischerella sp. JS2 TaxID=2597771 RepID=UPI0028E19123|nr:hypothetical protein [Fischerella sp. JS2]
MVLDAGVNEVTAEVLASCPQAEDLKTVIAPNSQVTLPTNEQIAIPATNPAEVAARVDREVERLVGSISPNVLLVPNDPGYAIPATYWAAQSGDVILFGDNPLPAPTREALARRNGKAIIYTLGSFDTNAISQFGTVRNIDARNEIGAAIAMAQYIDESTDVGWGIDTNKFGWRVDANYNFVLANRESPEMAIAGVSLGRFGKFGPLLWVERDRSDKNVSVGDRQIIAYFRNKTQAQVLPAKSLVM